MAVKENSIYAMATVGEKKEKMKDGTEWDEGGRVKIGCCFLGFIPGRNC